MALQTINEGISGQQAANIIYQNDEYLETLISEIHDDLPTFAKFDDIKNRILPLGYEFWHYDRPDLGDDFVIYVIDEDNEIVARIQDQPISVDSTYDRPDLGVLHIDEDGFIFDLLQTRGGGSVDPDEVTDLIKDSELISTFYEPDEQEGFVTGSSADEFWRNFDFYGEFDQMRTEQQTAQGYEPYISRELLGKSTKGDYDIYRYEFKPVFPTRKVIISAGIHGSEKISPMVLLRFFRKLCSEWQTHPVLTWARHNIHFVVIPLASPFGFHNRNRRVWETDPIPATWTKSGGVVTLRFNVADFPTNNPNVSADNYFTASDGVAGQTWVSLINSSVPDSVPDSGYKIQSVIDGQTVTVDAEAGGASSGTCEFFVSTDPNRGFDLPLSPWANSTTSSNVTPFTDPVAVPFDNKGTRFDALNESKFVRDTYNAHSDATFLVDMHNGAADYDTRFAAGVSIDPRAYQINNALHAGFTDKPFPVNIRNNNVASQHGSQVLGINAFTIEWGESVVSDKAATDAQRWMVNFILICARFYDKKITQ